MANKNDLKRAVSTLKEGGTIIYPTETCYGIGCDAMDLEALEKVYMAKKRPKEKKLTAIVSDIDMAEGYCSLSDIERKVCQEFMPGPLTLIAEKKPEVPDLLNDKFAFRVPDSKFCRDLCKELSKPIVATSANISGQPSSYSIEGIDPNLREDVDYIVDEGRLEKKPPSTIIDIEGGNLNVHREGSIKGKEIRGVIGGS